MNSKKAISIAASILVLVVLVIGGFLLYRSSSSKESTKETMKSFQTTVDRLKELRLQYSTGSYAAAYEALLDQCNLCLSTDDTDTIPSLTNHINELKQKIITEYQKIAEYKTKLTRFQNATSLYIITGDNKTEYNTLLSEFESAITRSDVASCDTLTKKLNEFLSTLQSVSEKQIKDANNSAKEYKKELEQVQKELKKQEAAQSKLEKQTKENSKKKSGDTNIYITPKTKEKEKTDTDSSKIIYILPTDADYILPDSSVRYLTRADLIGLTSKQLRIARNEIYARHGRKFSSKDLQSYFNKKSWYYGYISPKNFDDDVLTKIENKNIALIKKYEAKLK